MQKPRKKKVSKRKSNQWNKEQERAQVITGQKASYGLQQQRKETVLGFSDLRNEFFQ